MGSLVEYALSSAPCLPVRLQIESARRLTGTALPKPGASSQTLGVV